MTLVCGVITVTGEASAFLEQNATSSIILLSSSIILPEFRYTFPPEPVELTEEFALYSSNVKLLLSTLVIFQYPFM